METVVNLAFAQEMAHKAAEAATHGAAAEGGLPQFNPSYFPSQLFWLVVFFALFYFVLSQALLPKLGGVIERRENKVKGDIAAAAKANDAAQAALAAFEKSLATARAEARRLADVSRAEASELRAKAVAEADARLNERLAGVEARLAAERSSGLASAEAAGKELAAEIVAKLTGARAREVANA